MWALSSLALLSACSEGADPIGPWAVDSTTCSEGQVVGRTWPRGLVPMCGAGISTGTYLGSAWSGNPTERERAGGSTISSV